MKNYRKEYGLPVLTLALGIVCLVMRQLLYAVAVDEKNLLLRDHPLEIALWIAALGSAALIVLNVWKREGSNRYEENFGPSPAAALGHFLMAAGVGMTVLFGTPGAYGALGAVWSVLGILSVPALIWAGLCRLRGKQPFFLIHAALCLFLLMHIMNQYQRWCGDPQLMNYAFSLFAAMMLALIAYQTAAFEAGCGKRRMHLGTGLLSVLFAAAALSAGEYPFLHLGGISWALTNLCSMQPRPKEGEDIHDPS